MSQIDVDDLYERFLAMQWRKARQEWTRRGYPPLPNFRLDFAIDRQAAYARAAVRFADHCQRVTLALTPKQQQERIAA